MAKDGGKPGVMIYFETGKAVKGLDYEAKGRLFDAIMEYAEDGVVPALDGVLTAVWPFIANNIDRDSARYEELVEQKRRAGRASAAKRQALANERQQVSTGVGECQRNQPTTTTTTTSTPTTATTTTTERERRDENTHSMQTPFNNSQHRSMVAAYGRYNNVLLTYDEYQGLKQDIPGVDQIIEKLSEYIKSSGKDYPSHEATIRKWAREDEEREIKLKYSGNPMDHITMDDYANDSGKLW